MLGFRRWCKLRFRRCCKLRLHTCAHIKRYTLHATPAHMRSCTNQNKWMEYMTTLLFFRELQQITAYMCFQITNVSYSCKHSHAAHPCAHICNACTHTLVYATPAHRHGRTSVRTSRVRPCYMPWRCSIY